MTEKRLRPAKTISTEVLASLSTKFCSKIRDAANESLASATKGDPDAAERIAVCSYYILHIQQEFHDYCRIISGNYSTEKELYDICESVKAFGNAIRLILNNRGIIFVSEAPKNPAYALINYKKIQQALSAIVLNSIEHLNPGGKITLRVEETTRTVKISVHDNGSGMDEETLAHCMEPLFSGRRASGNRQPLGLGLTLARYYVQDCGGRIKIKSFDKKATKVEVIFPKPKELSVGEVHSVPKPLAGYDDVEMRIAFAPIL